MEDVSRDELLDKTNASVYKLTILATKRAFEIAEGAPKLVDASPDLKPTTVALMEIARGKVKYKAPKK
jgi:DNA-directed RNA polymerase omega subunit